MTATTAPPPDTSPLAVDSFGAARLLGVSESHWRVMLAAGRVPPGFRLGRRRLFAVAELLAWIQAGAPSADRWAAQKR
ncbi:MAG: helix-turn-helix domain-containing protein [Phycisphaerae bacterium]